MAYSVQDLENAGKFSLLLKISYNDLLQFVLEHLRKKSVIVIFFLIICILCLTIAVYIRITIAGSYPLLSILKHSLVGFIILPLLSIPIHEILHVVPYYISGARDIRAGMDLKQYLFYVTAHRFVAGPRKFRIVALFPFVTISIILLVLIFFVPDLWKWSLSLLLFLHATMCAGDFALLNFYFINRNKKIYTWDDADKKEAYFYEKLF